MNETRVTLQMLLPEGALRGWHLMLAQTLAARGHAVGVDVVPARHAPVAGLNVLRQLESVLYSRRPVVGIDPCAPLTAQDVAAFRAPTGAPQVILDLAGAAGPDAAVVLEPVFEGSADPAALVAALAAERPPVIGWRHARTAAFLAGGQVAIVSPHILTQGLADACARLVALADKAVRLSLTSDVSAVPASGPGGARLAGGMTLAGFAARNAAVSVQRRLAAMVQDGPQWTVGWRASSFTDSLLGSGRLQAEAFRWAQTDAGRFFADPFPFEHQGRRYIFVEELPYVTGRGFISVIELDADLQPVTIRPVLDERVHMSYPCVFRFGDHVWMIPETVARNRVELYRADPFPTRWELHAVLLDNIHAGDATLFAHDGLLWLSAATADHGATDRDSMSLFYATRLEGPWTPHPLNPVVVDVHGARPAGWIVKAVDGLRRPAQDCSQGYGSGLSLRRIAALSRDTYVETELARIAPPRIWRANAFHTVNWQAGIEAIDAVR